MSVKLTQANTKVVQIWSELTGTTYAEIVNRVMAEACMHFLDGMKASIKELQDKEETPTG